jgi:hypothetical protein
MKLQIFIRKTIVRIYSVKNYGDMEWEFYFYLVTDLTFANPKKPLERKSL